MTVSPPHPSSGPGPWYRWRGYTVRWLLFGLIVSLFPPVVDELASYWAQKLNQALAGLVLGLGCAVLFTLLQNRFNVARVSWKTGLLVLLSWLIVKVALVSGLALTGAL